MMNDETRFPHSPDVLERETSDNGFSRGWGMHFHPSADFYADMHGHFFFPDFSSAQAVIQAHMQLMKTLNVKRLVGCTPIVTRDGETRRPTGFDLGCIAGWDSVAPYFEMARENKAVDIMLFLHHNNPDVSILRQSIGAGARTVKLHNAPIIVDGGDPKGWLSAPWAEVFKGIEAAGLPVLWHVTQRLTDSPYTNGGRNVYWKDGWDKGITYTNADLLEIFLRIVEAYPGIPFIGAHQLHMGWENVDKLFSKYPNLHIDTSIGCFVQPDDMLYDSDRDAIRDFFIRHGDKILFGTDFYLTTVENRITESAKALIAGHIRFIKQLRLPDDVLQKVSHGNAEQLMRLL